MLVFPRNRPFMAPFLVALLPYHDIWWMPSGNQHGNGTSSKSWPTFGWTLDDFPIQPPLGGISLAMFPCQRLACLISLASAQDGPGRSHPRRGSLWRKSCGLCTHEAYSIGNWWMVTGTCYVFPYIIIYIGNNHPNWRSHIFQRGRLKPPTRKSRCCKSSRYAFLLKDAGPML